MKITETVIDHVPVVALEGRLDSATVTACADRLLALANDGRAALVLDLASVSHVSGAGLRCLVLVERFTRFRRIAFRVCGLRDLCAEMVALGGLTAQFHPQPDAWAAVRSLGR
ncbi:STAS domain-containing protein [Nitrospirillum sp. BR 11163]|uniref:STAS domain-containing protein n=1 Tax=Nitrospirillum sp. BR 11163 TaxID=3104323 RepID=UPI002AFF2055|nr:STAS domain-containing protein [Nitrospirillum sp. BR 11163]MEA1672861.1 STAS domain-containing protein [Nitrospirillum sp. BR 11163]